MATGAIIARIISQYSDKGSKAAQKDIAKMGKSFDQFAKKAAIAFAAVGVIAIKVGKDAVQAAMDDQKSQVLLANSLRNTVKASDATIASTENYITLLQKQVNVADDELRPALARLTAATGSIEAGQQLLSTALNVSAQSGADLASSSDAIIKATKGQYKSLGLLVPQLTTSTIKSKNFAKALGEVDAATVGAAGKRAGTLEYRLKGLQIAYGEVLETLGYALIPVIQNFVDIITVKVLPVLEAWIATNKDKLAKGLDTLLTQIPDLIIVMFNFFDFIQRNLKTLEILGALMIDIWVTAKVISGVMAITAAVNILTAAFTRQAVAGTAAGTATAFATGGTSALAAAAGLAAFTTGALVAFKELSKINGSNSEAAKSTDIYWGNVYDSAKATVKPVATIYDFTNKGLKLTAKQLKAQADQILSEKELARLKAMGVVPTSEVDPIQLEAIRLNLIKEQNLAQKAMYDQLLANYEAHNRLNIAAQRYADILMIIADNKITETEIALLASKWGATNIEVLKYIASVTGNINLGSGWDAAGLAAGDGWKQALKDVNAYLDAVGKANFVSKANVPTTTTTAPTNGPDIASLQQNAAALAAQTTKIYTLIDKINNTVKAEYSNPVIPGTGLLDLTAPQNAASARMQAQADAYFAANPNLDPLTGLPRMANGGIVNSATLAMIGESGPEAVIPLSQMGSMGTTVNVTINGSVTSASDLTETIRNGILRGQTSGRGITTRVLDL